MYGKLSQFVLHQFCNEKKKSKSGAVSWCSRAGVDRAFSTIYDFLFWKYLYEERLHSLKSEVFFLSWFQIVIIWQKSVSDVVSLLESRSFCHQSKSTNSKQLTKNTLDFREAPPSWFQNEKSDGGKCLPENTHLVGRRYFLVDSPRYYIYCWLSLFIKQLAICLIFQKARQMHSKPSRRQNEEHERGKRQLRDVINHLLCLQLMQSRKGTSAHLQHMYTCWMCFTVSFFYLQGTVMG